MSEAGYSNQPKQMPPFVMENQMEQLPVFVSSNIEASENGSIIVPQRDMANSAQNFNPMALQGMVPGRNGMINIADSNDNAGSVGGDNVEHLSPDGTLRKISSRNDNLQPINGKPNSAVLNKRIP